MTKMELKDLFKKYTTCRKTKTGYSVSCKSGFWAIYAPTKDEAEREAMNYFVQYYSDGEYNK